MNQNTLQQTRHILKYSFLSYFREVPPIDKKAKAFVKENIWINNYWGARPGFNLSSIS